MGQCKAWIWLLGLRWDSGLRAQDSDVVVKILHPLHPWSCDGSCGNFDWAHPVPHPQHHIPHIERGLSTASSSASGWPKYLPLFRYLVSENFYANPGYKNSKACSLSFPEIKLTFRISLLWFSWLTCMEIVKLKTVIVANKRCHGSRIRSALKKISSSDTRRLSR